MKKRNKIIISISILTIVLLVSVGLTYAAFTYNRTGETSELVLGDIYMHYKEKDKSINIDDMMPFEEYTLNTSEEKVELCVNYIQSKYGNNWNGMQYFGVEPKSNTSKDNIGKFMGALANTYDRYCAGETMEVEIDDTTAQPMSLDLNDNIATPIDMPVPTKEVNLLNDCENGVLTEADINYFVENGILTDNVKSLNYFEFDITGKNTNTKGTILYNIQLLEGDEPTIEENEERILERIADNFIRFRLVKVIDDEETILVNNKSYETINNTTIYSNIISKNTNEEISHTYRLYVWIDESVVIGNTVDANYTTDEWSNLFASIKVNVNGKYQGVENLTEKIKNKVGTEGLVAVNTEGNLYDGTGTIREYRYSGIGNYCTYTDGENDYNLSVEGDTCPTSACLMYGAVAIGSSDAFVLVASCTERGGTELPLKVEGSTPTDSGLRNYIEFNNGEMWRIIGVFGDNVKIVKDTPLENDIYTGETYTSGETTYTLKFTIAGTKYGYFYYNYPDDEYEGNENDWTKSGAMHYLNDETGNSYYVNNLSDSAKSMIETTTYSLGNVTVNSETYMLDGTASELYNQERGTEVCDSSVTKFTNESNCNIWNGNQQTWDGNVALIYPSDYAYASNTSNWTKNVGEAPLNGISLNNWLFNTDAMFNWFLSPSSLYPFFGSSWADVGAMSYYFGNIDYFALRPSLNLKSDVMVISGDGSYNNPYKLLEN